MKWTFHAHQPARRRLLRLLGSVAGYAGLAFASFTLFGLFGKRGLAAVTGKPVFPSPDYDWTKHLWGFGVDATRCIGCLQCVEACKTENGVARDAHHFRTWVERYVYIEGEKHPRVDSQGHPGNIAASGSQKEYRFDNRYKDMKVEKAFFVPKLCNQCENPPCAQVCPVGYDALHLDEMGRPVLGDACTGCGICIIACVTAPKSLSASPVGSYS